MGVEGGGGRGRVGVVILWAFLGRVRVFGWRVVGIYGEKHFAVVRPLKRLFDSTKNKRPAGGIPAWAQNKRGRFIFPPLDNISYYLITLFQNRFATFELLQNGF